MADADTRPLIVVLGITGKQGGAVCRHLVKAGRWRVKGVSRNPSSDEALAVSRKHPGVTIVKADCMDKQSLIEAFKGAHGVFALTNPFQKRWSVLERQDGSVEGEIKQGHNIVDACKEAHITHLVYSSVAEANSNTGVPTFEAKASVERYMSESGYFRSHATIFGPAGFMDNLIGPYGIKQGVVPALLKPHRKGQFIATDDIGWFVAHAFDQPDKWYGVRMAIAADELTADEQARILSRIRGGETWTTSTPPDWVFKLFIPKALNSLKKFLDEKGTHVDIEACRAVHPGLMTFEGFCMANGLDKAALPQPSSCSVQ